MSEKKLDSMVIAVISDFEAEAEAAGQELRRRQSLGEKTIVNLRSVCIQLLDEAASTFEAKGLRIDANEILNPASGRYGVKSGFNVRLVVRGREAAKMTVQLQEDGRVTASLPNSYSDKLRAFPSREISMEGDFDKAQLRNLLTDYIAFALRNLSASRR